MNDFWAGFFGMMLGGIMWTLIVAFIKGAIALRKAWKGQG